MLLIIRLMFQYICLTTAISTVMKNFIKVIDEMSNVHLIQVSHIQQIETAALGVNIYVIGPDRYPRKIVVRNLNIDQVRKLIEDAR